mgnify:CR=1 FL=1
MSEWIRKINWKYVVVMLIGNIILGLGIAIFKLSGLGNDPFSGMVMALAECVGIEYARFLILLNLGFFVIEIIWGRKLIGLGTIINALFLGYFVTFFYNLITSVIDAPDQMAMQVVTVFIGVIITSLGISMYQLPKQGVAPYDSISLIMTEKWPKIPYFWCRVSNDAISALVCWLAGGIVGLGTLVHLDSDLLFSFSIHILHQKCWQSWKNNKKLSCICTLYVENRCITETVFLFVSLLTAYMACFTCRWRSSASSHSSFTQFCRKLFTHGKHRLDHFVQRNQLRDSCESHFCGNYSVCHTCSISVLTWIFYQTTDRIAYQTKHVHKNSRCSKSTFFR